MNELRFIHLAGNEKEEAIWSCFYASLHILLLLPEKENHRIIE